MSNHRTPVIPLTVVTPATPGVIGSPQANTKLAPAAPTNGSSQSFAQDHWNRYAHLKNVDEAKNALIEDILSRYDAVVRQCQTLLDEKNEQESRSNKAVIQKQSEFITHLQTLMNGNPFVVVVVDGNNFLFNDAFVRDGEKGGRRAALVLKGELTEWVSKSVSDASEDFKVFIKVYADLKGLAGTFMRGGVIENLSTFSEFARGFNTLSLFDFVDIGGGDVNSKIVGKSWFHHLKLFLHDYHCRQVIFGGTPQLLDANVEQEDLLQRRVALLQSVSTNVNIPFKTVSFTEVFRTSKITPAIVSLTPRTGTPTSTVENGSGVFPVPRSRNDSRASSISIANAPAVPTVRTATPASTMENGSGTLPVPHSRNDSRASSISSANAPAVPTVKTWAKLAQAAVPLPQTSTVQRVVDPPTGRHNKKGQRIDPPFDMDREALNRVKKIKMCNMSYLHPDGCKFSEEKCNHIHSYKATAAEIELLKSVSRETPCKNGVRCNEVVCLYGHRCPYTAVNEGSMRGLSCTMGSQCRFPREMHGIMDTTPAKATKTGKR